MKSNSSEIQISEFKATCLKLLEQVKKTGTSILITKRGEPIAMVIPPPPIAKGKWLGRLKGSARIVGDIVSPVVDASEWEVMSE